MLGYSLKLMALYKIFYTNLSVMRSILQSRAPDKRGKGYFSINFWEISIEN